MSRVSLDKTHLSATERELLKAITKAPGKRNGSFVMACIVNQGPQVRTLLEKLHDDGVISTIFRGFPGRREFRVFKEMENPTRERRYERMDDAFAFALSWEDAQAIGLNVTERNPGFHWDENGDFIVDKGKTREISSRGDARSR